MNSPIPIGPYRIANPVWLAPMAGVTDLPFRKLCRGLGAGLTFSEMTLANSQTRNSRKTRLRLDHRGEPGPIIVQIAGGDPQSMVEAARFSVENGAQIVDINMGCPAKKVCRKAAGSALLANPVQVRRILAAVVTSLDVPVTLKIRTGTSPAERNGLLISQIAEDEGISAISIHGRTRACAFKGPVEYDTMAEIKSRTSIPIIANGDIDSPQLAREVLEHTGADAIMIGRAAQGRPWIFREIHDFLETGEHRPGIAIAEIGQIMRQHIAQLHEFYGPFMGTRIARKHLGWYLKQFPGASPWRKALFAAEDAADQVLVLERILEQIAGARAA